METLRKTKYQWENRLSYEDRQKAVGYYLQGYGIYRIGQTFGVTASTIEYHLKASKVFIPYKRPTLFGDIKQDQAVLMIVKVKRCLSTLTIFPKDTRTHYVDDRDELIPKPRSYKEIVRRQMSIVAKKRQHQRQQEEYKPTGFLVRGSISNNNAIVIFRKAPDYYEMYQPSSPVLVSGSSFSW